jgi:type IV pilus assembly protein PilM
LKLSKRKRAPVVGLDIEAGTVAAVEVTHNGTAKLGRTGIAPLPPGTMKDGEIVDGGALAETLKDFFAELKLPREVRVGVANQRVVVRTLRLPNIENEGELESAIRFQAQDHIPMPLERAVLDFRVIARQVGESGGQMDVVVAAARREMVDSLVDALRHAGLKPVGIDVSAFGMIRALDGEIGPAPTGQVVGQGNGQDGGEAGTEDPPPESGNGVRGPVRLYCNLGDVTNLAVAIDGNCLFTRVSPFGIEGVAQRLAERRGLTLEHAREWLVHVGLERPISAIEGDPKTVAAARDVLTEGASKLIDELRLSLDFYGAQEGAVAVEEIVAGGPGAAIEGLGARLQEGLGHSFRIGLPSALAHLDDQSAARLTLSYGLGLDE